MSSQGLIDLSKYVSVRLGSLGSVIGQPSLGSHSSTEDEVPSNLSDSGASLWVGIVMQAVSSIIYFPTFFKLSLANKIYSYRNNA